MIYTKRNLLRDIPHIIFALAAFTTVLLLLGIFIFLFFTGIGTFSHISFWEFLGTNWNPTSYHTPSWGILSLLLGTVMISVLSMLIAVPMGLSIAIFLSELTSRRIREIIKPLIEMIASIPSVVLGLLGLLFLAPFIAGSFHLSNGLNALTAAILVAIAALPTIASICEDALSTVGGQVREASLALGATQWQTIRRIVIPTAKTGLLAGIMLGLGRVIGETMIVLMVAGNSRTIPHSIFSAVSPMTATIAIDVKEVVLGSLHYQSLFAIGALLFIMTFVINFLADILIHKDVL